MRGSRNRLAWWLRRLADRIEWHEPECRFVVDVATGVRCGYYRDAGMHDTECPKGEDCPDPSAHHRFVR